MATANGVKKYNVEIDGLSMNDVANAFDVYIAQVERAIAKETDQDVVAIRMKQVQRLKLLKNHIMYGGKELV